MWNPVRVLIAQAQEISQLLAEQNSLLRELIQFHTRKPAQTPVRAASPSSQLRPPKPLGPPRTAKDVWTRPGPESTSEDQARIEEVARRMSTAQAQAQAQEISPAQ